MIQYPKKLDTIFNKLNSLNIKPIIVGGFIRDSLLNIPSKDIDIELYNLSSLDKLESILKEFGTVNSVGKSFGVCKLDFDGLDLDFSLPRLDSKVDNGHRGFKVKTDANLDFTTASRRRDFTINTIGYDVFERKLLDPYGGINDLKNRRLHYVDKATFKDDPLRVLRAIQFCARFSLTMTPELLLLCQNMIHNSCLNELPKERILGELEKLLLKSSQISIGFELLKEIGALEYFSELKILNELEWNKTLSALDELAKIKLDDQKKNIVLMFATLCYKLNYKNASSLIVKISNERELLKNVLLLISVKLEAKPTNYKLFTLAESVKIDELLTLHVALHVENKESYKEIKKRALELNILYKKMPPLVQGRDFIKLGMKASKEFSTLLSNCYEAQKNGLFKTHNGAILWLKKELLS